MNNIPPLDLIPMGKILKPIGLKGELKFFFFNELESSLKIGLEVWLKNKVFFSYIIEKIKISGKKSSIKFLNCDSRNDADFLKGLTLYLSREFFNDLPLNEHYLIDIVHSKIIDENQLEIGIVEDILSISSQSIIIAKIGKKEVLIPYVDDYIKLFDKINKELFVKNISGLIF